MILAGDIGGTHTRVAFFEGDAPHPKLVLERVYASREHSGLGEIVSAFISNQTLTATAACFGVAGPVIHGRVSTSNLAWLVDSLDLAKQIKIPDVFVINDLQAHAWSLAALEPQDVAELTAGTPEAKGNMALVAPGTGLGEAALYWDGALHRPLPSEAGHADWAARNDVEVDLLRYLIGRYGRVSYERILSGPGLVNVYEFLRDTGREQETTALREEIAHGDAAAVIAGHAMAGTAPICERALDIFISVLAAEAGNAVLRFVATAGVYLGGGIPAKILPKLRQPSFLEDFRNKGRLRPLLEAVPVRVVLNESAGLIGAARVALLNGAPRQAVAR